MQQVDLFGSVPERLHRRTDPETSAQAAAKVDTFKARHVARIYAAITAARERGATAREIARASHLDFVAVNRRLAEMRKNGLIERRYQCASDLLQQRDGCAIWWAK